MLDDLIGVWPNLAEGGGGGGIICTVMEAAEGRPYRPL